MPRRKARKNGTFAEVWKRYKRNKLAMAGLIMMALLFVIAVTAPFIIPYPFDMQDYDAVLLSPSLQHPFGTDNFGRDIFSRILYGTRYTLLIGFGCTTVAALVGSVLGALSAFYSKLDNLIMRFCDILMGIPTLIMAMSLVMALGISMRNMMIALCITTAPAFIRTVRAQVLTIKDQEYVEAARSIGAGSGRILIKYVFPNALAPIIVQYTLSTVSTILWAASLSFIGMGILPPTPEWGLMINAGRQYLRSNWYMSVFPGLAIILATFSLNLMGDGLRDALDPRLKR